MDSIEQHPIVKWLGIAIAILSAMSAIGTVWWFFQDQKLRDEIWFEADTEWNAEQACSALGVKLMEFDRADGNVQGFFRRSADAVAVSPLAEHARQTLFHELAHAVLHGDKDAESRSIEELEAECTAMLVADALGLGGLDDSRSYVQGWYKDGQQIPEKSAKRILHAADKILKAGQVEEPLAQAA